MTLALGDANKILGAIMRTIDKRAEYTAQRVTEGEKPAVVGTLTLRKKSTTVTVSLEALQASQQNAMTRNQVRTALKRALDGMQFVPNPIASTKMLRGNTSGDGFFRPPSGGRGGGRR